MLHPKSLIRLFAALPGIGLALSGCVAYGPSADYPASPYGYYGDYGGYSGYYGGYAPGYAYPPGYAYAPFFGSSLGFGQRFHGEHEDPDRFRRGNAPEHRGHGPTGHPPGPAHAAPARRPPALSGQTTPPHGGATHGHGPEHGRSNSGDGRPRS